MTQGTIFSGQFDHFNYVMNGGGKIVRDPNECTDHTDPQSIVRVEDHTHKKIGQQTQISVTQHFLDFIEHHCLHC